MQMRGVEVIIVVFHCRQTLFVCFLPSLLFYTRNMRFFSLKIMCLSLSLEQALLGTHLDLIPHNTY